MKKIILYLIVIIAGILLISNLDWTLKEWSQLFVFLLFVRIIRLVFKRPNTNTLEYKVEKGISQLTGYKIPWVVQRIQVITEDYTSGSIKGLIYKWTVTVLGVASLIFLIISGFIYVLAQPVFWKVLGGIAGFVLILYLCINLFKRAKKNEAERAEKRREEFKRQCDSMVDEFVNTANIPMSKDAITRDNFAYCEKSLSEIKDLIDAIPTSKGSDLYIRKRQLADKKLEVFYAVSLYSQSLGLTGSGLLKEEDYFAVINKAIENNDYNILRCFTNFSADDDAEINQFLFEQKSLLEDNTITPYIDELNKYKDMDTSTMGGLFTSSSKLAKKASILKKIFYAAESEYKELANVRDKINYLLDIERVSSYKSIYLGVELINFVRDNAGGKSLEKASDLVDFDIEIDNIDLRGAGNDSDVMGLAVNSLSSLFDRCANDEQFLSYALENPKETIGNEALVFIGNAIRERNEAISLNNEAIEQIIIKIPELVDAYTSGQAQLLRAIEIIKALIKTNQGFDNIYAPLYRKAFVDNEVSSISIQDIRLLTGALIEFNKIAKSEIS